MVGLVGSGSEDRTGQQDQEIHMSARMVERGRGKRLHGCWGWGEAGVSRCTKTGSKGHLRESLTLSQELRCCSLSMVEGIQYGPEAG